MESTCNLTAFSYAWTVTDEKSEDGIVCLGISPKLEFQISPQFFTQFTNSAKRTQTPPVLRTLPSPPMEGSRSAFGMHTCLYVHA